MCEPQYQNEAGRASGITEVFPRVLPAFLFRNFGILLFNFNWLKNKKNLSGKSFLEVKTWQGLQTGQNRDTILMLKPELIQ